jgi:hypothetical protein
MKKSQSRKKLLAMFFVIPLAIIGWCLYYSGKTKVERVKKQTELNKQLLRYKIERYIDLILPVVFLSFALLWLAQSIITIMLAGSFFTPIHLWLTPITMHVTTSLNCTLIYLISYHFYRTFQFGHERVVRALLFTVFGVIFYDLVWATSNYVIDGSGSFILPLASTVVIAFYIWLINRQKKILDLNWKHIVPVVLFYILTLAIFISSGFFQQWGLYEQGLAVDPTGWQWLLNKTVALWMWIVFALR